MKERPVNNHLREIIDFYFAKGFWSVLHLHFGYFKQFHATHLDRNQQHERQKQGILLTLFVNYPSLSANVEVL